MDRRMKTIVRAGLLAAVAISAVLLAACSDVNIISLLTTEVKRANNKFLVIQSVDPVNGSTGVNPGIRISVRVDRTVDMSTVSDSTVQLQDLTGTDSTVFILAYTFNETTKTLYLDSDPWLGDNTDYVLTIKQGVKGTDGSDLETAFTWSFRTSTYPKGNVKIEADKAATNKAYPSPLSLSVLCNKVSNMVYRLGQSESECLASGAWHIVTGTSFTDSSNFGFASGSLDGAQSVYIQFKDEFTSEMSTVRSDSITLDTIKPTITVYSPTIYHNSYGPATPSIASSDDRSGVDTTTYQWSGGSLLFSAATVQTPTITVIGAENTPFTASVTVKDLAGNTSTAGTMGVIKDTLAPDTAPLITTPTPSPAFTPAPRWNWSSRSTFGGEPTAYFKYELRNSAGTLFYSRPSTMGTYYTPKIEWPNYTRGTPPDEYTMTVWERDLAGNQSSSSALAITVTSILPIDRAAPPTVIPSSSAVLHPAPWRMVQVCLPGVGAFRGPTSRRRGSIPTDADSSMGETVSLVHRGS
jgi:hypothetical protein